MDERSCGSMKHPEHICSLTKNGCAAEVARLSKDPAYRCETCGATSHASDNLCTPSLIGT